MLPVHLHTKRIRSFQQILKEAFIPNQKEEDSKYTWPRRKIMGLGRARDKATRDVRSLLKLQDAKSVYKNMLCFYILINYQN